MTGRPWMPLYVADYLADTMHLNAAQSGAYLHLIMHYWQHGSLPEDDQKLSRIARMRIEDWRRHRGTVEAFFKPGWRHPRIDSEIKRSGEISNKRKEAALQMHSKCRANAPANAEQMHTQSQSHIQSKKEADANASYARASDWPPGGFDIFWQTYPHKIGKSAAVKSFATAKKTGVPWAQLIGGLNGYIATKPIDRAWCNPATWLNQGRWDDQPAPVIQVLQNGYHGSVPRPGSKEDTRERTANALRALKASINSDDGGRGQEPREPISGFLPFAKPS